MIKKSDNRGSHVGLVLSFVIFVVFLVFIYSVLTPPIETKKNREFAIEHLEPRLLEVISGNLTEVIYSPESACGKIYHANVSDEELNFIAKEVYGDVVGANDFGDYILIDRSSEDILIIYYSEEEFNAESTNETDCSEVDIQSVKKYNYIFETRIADFIYNYDSGYETLKDLLEIPDENEFGFKFKYENGTEVVREMNVSSDVYAREIPVHYVDKNADIVAGTLTIKTW